MRLIHQLAKAAQIANAESLCRIKHTLIFADHMTTAAIYDIRQLGCVVGQVFEGHVTQRAHRGRTLSEDLDPRFTLLAATVVLPARQLMFHHAVADDQPGIIRNGKRLRLKRTAVNHQGVAGAGKYSNKLVHDPAPRTNVFVLSTLTDLHQVQRRHFLL